MTHAMSRIVLTAIVVCVAAAVPVAQQTTSTETKSFEVISVDGNQLVVTLPEGTRELTVPDDFQFNVDGQPMTVRELKAGMKGTATITTRTTMMPVTVSPFRTSPVTSPVRTSTPSSSARVKAAGTTCAVDRVVPSRPVRATSSASQSSRVPPPRPRYPPYVVSRR